MADNTHTDTNARMASPAYLDNDLQEGRYDADSVRAAMINRPREEFYAFWCDYRNLPAFMENVKSVELLESGRSSWMITGPGGSEHELVSETVEIAPASASPGAAPKSRRSTTKAGSNSATTPSAGARRCACSSAMTRPRARWANSWPRSWCGSRAYRPAASCAVSNS